MARPFSTLSAYTDTTKPAGTSHLMGVAGRCAETEMAGVSAPPTSAASANDFENVNDRLKVLRQ